MVHGNETQRNGKLIISLQPFISLLAMPMVSPTKTVVFCLNHCTRTINPYCHIISYLYHGVCCINHTKYKQTSSILEENVCF